MGWKCLPPPPLRIKFLGHGLGGVSRTEKGLLFIWTLSFKFKFLDASFFSVQQQSKTNAKMCTNYVFLLPPTEQVSYKSFFAYTHGANNSHEGSNSGSNNSSNKRGGSISPIHPMYTWIYECFHCVVNYGKIYIKMYNILFYLNVYLHLELRLPDGHPSTPPLVLP